MLVAKHLEAKMYEAVLRKGDKVISTFTFHVEKPEDFSDGAAEAFEYFRQNTDVSLLDDDVTVVFRKA